MGHGTKKVGNRSSVGGGRTDARNAGDLLPAMSPEQIREQAKANGVSLTDMQATMLSRHHNRLRELQIEASQGNESAMWTLRTAAYSGGRDDASLQKWLDAHDRAWQRSPANVQRQTNTVHTNATPWTASDS